MKELGIKDKYLRVDQIATRLTLSARYVRRLIESGRLPARRFGTVRAVRVRESDVVAFEESRLI